jgi:hypothetical protein
MLVGGNGIPFAARIGHRLAAASLPFREMYGAAEAFQKLKRGNTHLRVKLIDVAGYE